MAQQFDHPLVILALLFALWLGYQANEWKYDIAERAAEAGRTVGGWFDDLTIILGRCAIGIIVVAVIGGFAGWWT